MFVLSVKKATLIGRMLRYCNEYKNIFVYSEASSSLEELCTNSKP